MTPYVSDADFTLYVGDVLETLRELPDESVDCVVTSPPYWGLRDYGTGEWEGGNPDHEHETVPARGGRGGSGAPGKQTEGAFPSVLAVDECSCGARRVDRQIGLEPTPDLFVARMVEVFREVRRVLCSHGTAWVNLGDSYNAYNGGAGPSSALSKRQSSERPHLETGYGLRYKGLKPKDLVGIPWRVAFALQADGWWLRSDIIWSKPNPMPESVTDRPTKAHEYVFLLTKGPRYWFDQEAVRERYTDPREGGEGFRWHSERYTNQTAAQSNHTPNGRGPDGRRVTKVVGRDGSAQHRDGERWPHPSGRNIRSVWEIATQPYPEAHFATFPEELPRRAISAGCPRWVCRVCGKPRERVVERAADNRPVVDGSATKAATVGPTGSERRLGANGWNLPSAGIQTVGWSDCGHNAYRCLLCHHFVHRDDYVRRDEYMGDKCPKCGGRLLGCGDPVRYRPGVVLDPFMGSGTTALVARRLERHSIGIELNPAYAELCARRLAQLSLLAEDPAA